MTRDEMLLVKAMEECNEVAHRISKALRFGVNEIQEGQAATNWYRVREEFVDLMAVLDMLHMVPIVTVEEMAQRRERVERYLRRSLELGTLSQE